MSSSSSSSPFFQLFFIFSSSILLLLLLMSTMQTTSATTTNNICTTSYKNFIKTACNSTRYPKDCNKALSPYASTIKTDTQKLCNTALSVTLNATCVTSSSIQSAVSKLKGLTPSETQIINDCAETITDAINELNNSLKAMAYLQGSDRVAQLKNIRTWVSAALTNEYTCTDEFEGQKVSKALKNTIKKSMLYLAKLTSNFLELLNLLDY